MCVCHQLTKFLLRCITQYTSQ
uniref:Uncharacterized protein n=1 Tax=Arundo donax TaxID=35708 RepID=A0A0A9AZ82_ARUDO